jgi:hypothetical protein
MEYTFSARCDVTMEHTKGDTTSKHLKTDLNLEVSKNLARDHYFTPDELPNKDGVKALSQTLLQGLAGNIHYAQQKGYWNDVEHIKYVVAELTKGFAAVSNVTASTFGNAAVNDVAVEEPTQNEPTWKEFFEHYQRYEEEVAKTTPEGENRKSVGFFEFATKFYNSPIPIKK